jgi:hypothetical protein
LEASLVASVGKQSGKSKRKSKSTMQDDNVGLDSTASKRFFLTGVAASLVPALSEESIEVSVILLFAIFVNLNSYFVF